MTLFSESVRAETFRERTNHKKTTAVSKRNASAYTAKMDFVEWEEENWLASALNGRLFWLSGAIVVFLAVGSAWFTMRAAARKMHQQGGSVCRDKMARPDSSDLQFNRHAPPAILSCVLFKSAPAGRVDGCLVLNERTQDLLLLGGLGEDGLLGDEQLFSLDDMDWVRLKKTSGPGPRSGHCAAWLDGVIIVYGGSLCVSRHGKELYDDGVYLLDLKSGGWSQPNIERGPRARAAATLTAWRNDRLVLFGGRMDDGVYLNDAWCLELDENHSIRWTEIVPVDDLYIPPGRDRHAAVCVADSLVVFGGTNTAGTSAPGCLEVFNLLTRQWRLRETIGNAPSQLPGMLAHRVGNADLVCVIGAESAGIFNQIFLLAGLAETDHPLIWTLLQLEWHSDWTIVPGRCDGHFSAASAQAGAIFVFGGQSDSGYLQNTMLVIDVAEAAGIAYENDGDLDNEPMR